MAVKNTFYLDVDIKQKNFINEPEVTSNDSVTFILRITDDGLPYDLSNVTTFTLVSVRPDRQSVMTLGTLSNDEIIFSLGTTELELPGKISAVIQMYDTDGRVSTIPFTYQVLNDPANNYIPSEKEKTLIELVLTEGPVILAAAKQATKEALEAAEIALNSKGPKGEPGPIGPEGPRGPIGLTGPVGPEGQRGPQGVAGPKGESFKVDATGLLSERSAHDGKPIGFSYLATDSGMLYIRQGTTGWSGGIPFGKGEKGDQGVQGPQGVPGTPGVKGADGKTWHSGTTVPANTLGAIGDWHLNTTDYVVREKTAAAVWTSRGSLKGPQGIQGPQGIPGPSGSSTWAGITDKALHTQAEAPHQYGNKFEWRYNAVTNSLDLVVLP